MSYRERDILAVEVTSENFDRFAEAGKYVGFTWKTSNTMMYPSVSNSIIVYLSSSRRLTWNEVSTHNNRLPDMDVHKYDMDLVSAIEPKFKRLLQELRIKPTVKMYNVSRDFIMEAHKAACVDWKSRIEEEFPEIFPKRYKIGDRFIRIDDEVDYILARGNDAYSVTLVNLNDGTIWSTFKSVGSYQRIIDEEMNTITKSNNWKKVFKLKE
jgi:hypothetical protein